LSGSGSGPRQEGKTSQELNSSGTHEYHVTETSRSCNVGTAGFQWSI